MCALYGACVFGRSVGRSRVRVKDRVTKSMNAIGGVLFGFNAFRSHKQAITLGTCYD